MRIKSVAKPMSKKVLELCLYVGMGSAFALGLAFLFMVGLLAWLVGWRTCALHSEIEKAAARNVMSPLR